MTVDQIDDEVLKLKKEQFNLRFQRATGQLENTSRVREVRRDIARLKTVARQKRVADPKPARAPAAQSRSRRVKRVEMPKRTLQGVVVSDKQDKTVIVRVERRFTHPVMKKTVRRSNKFHAHDEKNEYSVGDIVWIEEHRPISKLKRWIVIQGEKRASPEAPLETEPSKRSAAADGEFAGEGRLSARHAD